MGGAKANDYDKMNEIFSFTSSKKKGRHRPILEDSLHGAHRGLDVDRAEILPVLLQHAVDV